MKRAFPIAVIGVAVLFGSVYGAFAQTAAKDRAAGLALEQKAAAERAKALAERNKNPAQAKIDMTKAQVDMTKGMGLVAKSKKER